MAPLRLRGRRGKQSTPRVWLGGTGEHSAVDKREDKERGTRREARDVSEAGEWPRYDFNFWQDCVEWLVLDRLWRFVLLMVIGKMFMSGMHVYLVCVFLHGMHFFLGVSAIGIPLHAVAFDIPRMWFCVVIRC